MRELLEKYSKTSEFDDAKNYMTLFDDNMSTMKKVFDSNRKVFEDSLAKGDTAKAKRAFETMIPVLKLRAKNLAMYADDLNKILGALR